MQTRIVLVEPKYEGNIGSIARVMKNFGFTDLFLVNPPELGNDARIWASHASDVISCCKIFKSLDDALKGSNIVVGTTSKTGKEAVRTPIISPKELREKIEGKEGIVSILFGREDVGLYNRELARCDIVVRIPTSHEYPVMNVSHAVTIILYELRDVESKNLKIAGRNDIDLLLDHYRRLFDEIRYPTHKKEKTLTMLRRIFGRAGLTEKEVRTLRGILRKTEWRINKK
ncbi:MAG: RNA methyltransferase [Candidatus Syntropharchaeia archaeon]